MMRCLHEMPACWEAFKEGANEENVETSVAIWLCQPPSKCASWSMVGSALNRPCHRKACLPIEEVQERMDVPAGGC
jgi:hypothetical protein